MGEEEKEEGGGEEEEEEEEEKDLETRAFDATTGTTIYRRRKESSAAYRFLPEPDLLPLTLSSDLVQEIHDDDLLPSRDAWTRYLTEEHGVPPDLVATVLGGSGSSSHAYYRLLVDACREMHVLPRVKSSSRSSSSSSSRGQRRTVRPDQIYAIIYRI